MGNRLREQQSCGQDWHLPNGQAPRATCKAGSQRARGEKRPRGAERGSGARDTTEEGRRGDSRLLSGAVWCWTNHDPKRGNRFSMGPCRVTKTQTATTAVTLAAPHPRLASGGRSGVGNTRGTMDISATFPLCDNCAESRPLSGYRWCDVCRFEDPQTCPWCDEDKHKHAASCGRPACERAAVIEVMQ